MSDMAGPLSRYNLSDLGERIIRQIIETSIPVLSIIGINGIGSWDALRAMLLMLGAAIVISVGKAILVWLTGLQVDAGSNRVYQLIDRSLPAAAAVLLAAWPDAFAELLRIDWRVTLLAAASAGLWAIFAAYAVPARSAKHLAGAE